MSNAMVRQYLGGPRTAAFARLVGVSAIAGVLAVQLPDPMALVRGLGSSADAVTSYADHPVGVQLADALLAVCGLAIWAVLAYLAIVMTITLFIGIVAGRDTAARISRRLLPRALRGVVATLIGVSAVAGLSACAPAAAPRATVTGSVAEFAADGGTATLDLDWPDSTTTASMSEADVIDAETMAGDNPWTVSLDWPTAPAVAGSITAPATMPATTSTTGIVPVGTSDPSTTTPGDDQVDRDPALGEIVADPSPVPVPTPLPTDPASSVPAGAVTQTSPTVVDVAGTSAFTDQPDAGSASAPSATVTIQIGDSLWSIAADHLGSDADAAAIAASWPDWYAANRDLIGDNPDQLTPGWQLVVPTLTSRP